MSNMTKRMLAFSLRKLLSKTTLDNITIQDITDGAEVSRKTFYYHFQDIYDLMEWTLNDDAQRFLKGGVLSMGWKDGLGELIRSMQEENRMLVLNAYRSLGPETLGRYIIAIIEPLMNSTIDHLSGSENLSESDRKFTVHLYSYGLVGLLLGWIHNDMQFDEDMSLERIDRFFTTSLPSWINQCTQHLPK